MMRRLLLFLVIVGLAGLVAYEPPEDRTGWIFPGINPFIRLELKSFTETGPVTSVIKPGESIALKNLVNVVRKYEIENRYAACILPIGAQMTVLEVDQRGYLMIFLSHVADEVTPEMCAVGNYTMEARHFIHLQSMKGEV